MIYFSTFNVNSSSHFLNLKTVLQSKIKIYNTVQMLSSTTRSLYTTDQLVHNKILKSIKNVHFIDLIKRFKMSVGFKSITNHILKKNVFASLLQTLKYIIGNSKQWKFSSPVWHINIIQWRTFSKDNYECSAPYLYPFDITWVKIKREIFI